MVQYPIFENEMVAGEVTLQKEGLFCKLHCHFTVKKPGRYRLICYGGETQLDLGCGVPEGNGWVIKRFFPWRNLPDKEPKFLLEAGAPIKEIGRQKLVSGEPVEQISKLVTGKLYCCEDGYWVVDTNMP